jgi:4-aminobutyrate aminotransferase-like enzyme
MSLGTFRGNVLAYEVGAFVLDYMQKKRLIPRASDMDEYMLKRANEISEHSKYVGDVRGRGLMIGGTPSFNPLPISDL